MNKWQIICPLVALLLAAGILEFLHTRNHRRAYLLTQTTLIGHELITSTNSERLMAIGPDLEKALGKLLRARTKTAGVVLGDAPKPAGDGGVCSRLALTNEAGESLLIRLGRTKAADRFQVLGFDATVSPGDGQLLP